MVAKIVSINLFLIIPLLFRSPTTELFEFPKMMAIYLVAATLLAFSVYTIFTSAKNKSFNISGTIIIWLVLIIIYGGSCIYALHPPTAIFGYFTRWTGGLVSTIAFSVIAGWLIFAWKDKITREIIFKSIVTSLLLINLYAFLQKVGFDRILWENDPASRVFSTLGQPNWLASFLVAYLPLLMVFRKDFGRKWQGVIQLAIITSLMVITLTKSVSGMLALLAVLLILFLVGHSSVINKKKVSILLVCGLLGLGGLLSTKSVQLRTSETSNIRLIVWQGTINLFIHSPGSRKLFGYGAGNFAYAHLPYRPQALNSTTEWDYLYNKPHNMILEIVSDLGLVGLAVYICWLLYISRLVLINKQNNPRLIYYWAGFLSLWVSNLFGFLVVLTTLQLYFLTALIASESEDKGMKINISRVKYPLAVILAILSGLLFIIAGRQTIAELKYDRANALLIDGDPIMAIEEINTAIKIYPYEPRYLTSLGFALTSRSLGLKGSPEAIKYADLGDDVLQLAYAANPYSSILLRSVMYSYLNLSDIDRNYLAGGLVVANQAMEHIPTDATLPLLTARMYYLLEDYSTAAAYLNTALKLKSDLPMGLFLKDEWRGKHPEMGF